MYLVLVTACLFTLIVWSSFSLRQTAIYRDMQIIRYLMLRVRGSTLT